jgi:hypothetical protein
LKESFRRMCIQKAGGIEKIGPLVAAIYTVTAKQVRDAVEKHRKKAASVGAEDLLIDFDSKTMPLMSFPWIFDRELAKIAASPGNVFEAIPSQSSWMQMTAETSIDTIPAANASGELSEEVLMDRKDTYLTQSNRDLFVDRSHSRMIEAGTIGSMQVAQEASQLVEGSHIKQAVSGLSTLNNGNARADLHVCMVEDDNLVDGPSKVEFDTEPSALDRLAQLVAYD